MTVLSLVVGVIFMGNNGIINKKYSTKLMSFRVGFQALAIILALLIYYIK
jgi:hypothetical protein